MRTYFPKNLCFLGGVVMKTVEDFCLEGNFMSSVFFVSMTSTDRQHSKKVLGKDKTNTFEQMVSFWPQYLEELTPFEYF